MHAELHVNTITAYCRNERGFGCRYQITVRIFSTRGSACQASSVSVHAWGICRVNAAGCSAFEGRRDVG